MASMQILNLFVPVALVRELETVQARAAKRAGLRVSRAEITRECIRRGLADIAAEYGLELKPAEEGE